MKKYKINEILTADKLIIIHIVHNHQVVSVSPSLY